MGSMTVRTAFTNNGRFMDTAAGLNNLGYVLMTIIAEFRFIPEQEHGVIAPVWFMALLAILDHGKVDMPHLELRFKLFPVAEETERVTLADQKLFVKGGMGLMAENARPLCCRGMGVFLVQQCFLLFVTAETEIFSRVRLEQI